MAEERSVEALLWASEERPQPTASFTLPSGQEISVRSGEGQQQQPLSRQVGADLTGRGVWGGAGALASHVCRECLRTRENAAGKRVLELGAGLGLPGLAAAAMGATVTLTERPLPELLARLEANAASNSAVCKGRASVFPLDWSSADQVELLRAERGPFDLILGSELVYRKEVYPSLMHAVKVLSEPRGGEGQEGSGGSLGAEGGGGGGRGAKGAAAGSRAPVLLSFRERFAGQASRLARAAEAEGLRVVDLPLVSPGGGGVEPEPSPVRIVLLTDGAG